MFKTNFKLYLKTLVASFKYILIIIVMMAGGGILLMELLENLPDAMTNAILGLFPSTVSFLISLKVRLSNEDLFDDYVRATGGQKLTIPQDLKHLLFSKHFRLELLVFATYMLAIILFFTSGLGAGIFLTPTLWSILLTTAAMFLVPDVLSWMIVHGVYRRKM
jgi:hypothetical protein